MIELKQLSKKFGKKTIYQDVNLIFEAGKTYALVGTSGSGKTTLLNAIGRLEKPSSGQVLVDGKNIWQTKEKRYFKDYLGYIFQSYALIDDKTVAQNFKIIDKNKQTQIKVLEKVGLDASCLSAKIYELSGGQAQRVAIARILLKRARIILADEPTGALDATTGMAIRDLLLGLVSEESVVIFATHDPDIYKKVDHVIDLSAEKTIENHTLTNMKL